MKPNIDRLMGNRVRFTDGSEEQLDAIIYATGYKINFPFLSPEVYQVQANVMNLYLHVVPPELPGLYFRPHSAVGGDYASGRVTGAMDSRFVEGDFGFAR